MNERPTCSYNAKRRTRAAHDVTTTTTGLGRGSSLNFSGKFCSSHAGVRKVRAYVAGGVYVRRYVTKGNAK